MIGSVVMSSIDTPPIPRDQPVPKPELFEGRLGRRGKGMGPSLKPLDSGTPYGIKLCYGFSLLRSCEGEG